ncbi:hypothetical protein SARC_12347 [Sphaeroforma arctica JP610]|uniref:DUF676 domain-containing protein n=1 Tax=Sphaeroforma arctica JP610 TaxID=667725 RepID=A0A0L0FED1_9EUKA|nr:hypothetical protein SARC_12347 [Sphaeroforma arctica JP610]KNC75119.1 hypothetical protein SARC_12347 [Sphaeroforma arctica JP610]|eukprot:XP_014149021.1 hypothetical protein SARC_12347 [Sphaeroforma arctica JP610]
MQGQASGGVWFGNQLKKKYGTDIVYITTAINETGWNIFAAPTHDGVDVCGRRLADEIRSTIKANPSLTHISLCGLSLGGLIIRYTCGELYESESGTIGGLIPLNFVSFASPHLGVRKTLPGFMGVLGGFIVGNSYHQMTLADNANKKTCNTLLERMAGIQTPECAEACGDKRAYLKALSSFQRRLCIGNVESDPQVPYPTATMVPFFHPAHMPVDRESQYANIVRIVRNEELPSNPASIDEWFNSVGAEELQAERIFEDESPEYKMLVSIREATSWTRVDTRFEGFMRNFSHDLVAVNKPAISTAGQGVVQFVVDEMLAPFKTTDLGTA